MDFEKLGAFYLGKAYDLARGELLDELVMYDARDLTTHAVCVGMTGSGKTGLCVSLLEEAAIDNIPAVVVDPKGDLANLLLAPYFKEAVEAAQENWRKVVSSATLLGIPIPAFSSAISYFDSYRRERLPANMIQAQRDFFGAHTYERVDRDGTFHTEWLAD